MAKATAKGVVNAERVGRVEIKQSLCKRFPARLRDRRQCARLEQLEGRMLLAATDPIISEFLANNNKNRLDDFNEASAWIELYNPGPAVNLAGWHLTDDPADLDKWTFPSINLPQNGFLTVWASRRNRTDPSKPLHTNFRLNNSGEYLALVRPNLQVIHAYNPYPAQVADVSYGVMPGTPREVPLISADQDVRAYVPFNDSLGLSWTQRQGFDDGNWLTGRIGVGYEVLNPKLPSEIEPNDAMAQASNGTYNFVTAVPGNFQLSIRGSIHAAGNSDYFKIGAMQAGDVLTIAVGGSGSGRGTLADPKLKLYSASGGSAIAISPDPDNAGPGNDGFIGRFSVTTAGTYYIEVSSPGTGSYELGVFLENAGAAPTTGGSVSVETESNDTFGTATDASASWRAAGYLSHTGASITAGDTDLLRFQFQQGDVLTVHIDSTFQVNARVSLLGDDGVTVLAGDDGSSQWRSGNDDNDAAIYGLRIPATGTYYVKVQGVGGTTGNYNANLYLSSAAPPPEGGTPIYTDLLQLDTLAAMRNVNSTAYLRVPFYVPDLSAMSGLTLRMKYDDGFVAYLNGVEVARRNAPANPAWNSAATADRTKAQAVTYEDIDIKAFLDRLVVGENVLAIQALNSSVDDTELLIYPTLTGVETRLYDEQYFVTPTYGQANQAGTLGYVKDTKFSVKRGFYDAPFDVAITTGTSGAQIRYTLDGSMPSATTGTLYTGPIRISTTTTLRAIAYKAGYQPTNVDTQTYIFTSAVIQQPANAGPATWGGTNNTSPDYAMDPRIVSPNPAAVQDALKSLPVMSLVMPLDDWFGATNSANPGIYPTFNAPAKRTSVEFFTADGSEQFQIDADIGVVGEGIGGTSGDRWKTYKLNMKLNFRPEYGAGQLRFPLFGEDAADSFDQLILDAQINYTWTYNGTANPTVQRGQAKLIQDQYIADLQNAMGGYGPHGRFVHLYINGLYWGVYDVHERPDHHFAQEYFGGDDDNYDAIKHGLRWGPEAVVNGTADAYYDLLNRVNANLTDNANYRRVLDVLDIDSFIDYVMLNFWAGNQDWPHKNYYATRERTNGKWRFHSWDAEHTLRSLGEYFTDKVYQGDTQGPGYIHFKLIANPEYRLRFADRVHKHMFNDGVLTPAKTAAYYQARMNEVDAAMLAESARWGDNTRPAQPYTQADWRATQQGLLANYFPVRTGNIFNGQYDPANYSKSFVALGLYTALDAPEYGQHGGTFAGPTGLTITKNAAQAGFIYYTTDGSDPRVMFTNTVGAAAQLYAGAVNLTRSAVVKARVYDPGTDRWSALTEATFIVGSPPPLRVTEVMYNPAPPPPNTSYTSESYEYIELANLGSEPLTIGGYSIGKGISFTFPPGSTVLAGERIIVAANPTAFQSRYGSLLPPLTQVFGPWLNVLGDEDDRIQLKSDLGQVIEDFEYKGSWFGHTNGDGFSLVAIDPMASNATLSSKAGWRPSAGAGGSPASADAAPTPGAVVISEIMSHTDGAMGDWIELHNTTASPIDISGWFLSDSAVKLDKYAIQNTVIPAGGYVYFNFRDHFGNAGNPGFRESFGFSELGEDAYLTSVYNGQPGGYREHVDFGASDREVSFGRYVKSTNATDFVPMISPSPGQKNPGPRIGPVVINEIMYNPAGSGLEWIELRNIGGSPVPLYDPLRPGNTWRISGGISFSFPGGASIPAGSYAMVVPISPATFRAQYGIPGHIPVYGPYIGVLNGAGDKIEIKKPGEPEAGTGFVPYIAVDRVNYDDDAPWPASPDGGGPSLARLSATSYGNDAGNWAAEVIGGSPGRSNFGIDSDAPVADIIDISPDPRGMAVLSVTIVFDEAVTGFDLSDLRLTRNGGANLLTGGELLTSGDNITWTLEGIAALTADPGNYVLTLTAGGSGIRDAAGNPMLLDASDAFVVDTAPPSAQIAPPSPSPRRAPVSSLTITFTKPVTGFDRSDLSLTRDGGANLLTGAQTLTTSDGVRFSLNNLAGLTAEAGTYTLALTAAGSGIMDGSLNGLSGDATMSWTMDLTAPTADIIDVSPDPRTTGVLNISIVFSEAVYGLDLSDLSLSRNGGANLLTALQTLTTQDNVSWTLGNLPIVTNMDGSYVLRLAAGGSGIADGAGNALAADASDEFLVDTGGPGANIVDVSPDPGRIAPNTITIVFTEPVTGFDLADLSLARDGGPNLLTGAQTLTTADSITWTLGNLAGLLRLDGTYVLTLRAEGSGIEDGAGNGIVAGDIDTFALDLTAPGADIVDVSPDPRQEAVATIQIVFTEPVANLDLSDLMLTRDGGANLLTQAQTLISDDNLTWTLGNLLGLTAADGTYTLTVMPGPGLTDAVGNTLIAAVEDSFVVDARVPTVDIVDVTPDPHFSAVDAIAIVFSEAVYGFDLTKLSFSRNGGPNLLDGTAVLTRMGGLTWMLSNLDEITSIDGNYVLELDPSGITDAAGQALAAGATEAFSIDVTRPTATIDPQGLVASPRTQAIESIVIQFSEDVSGFDKSDLLFNRNGGPNLLTGAQTLTKLDGRTWRLENLAPLTGIDGAYLLKVVGRDSGIEDVNGNPILGEAARQFLIDNFAPIVDIVDVSPDPRSSSVNSITLVFSEPVSGLSVTDLELTRDGGANLLTPAQTLSSADGIFWTLGNLAALTNVDGVYVLSLGRGMGIMDRAGNDLAAPASEKWVRGPVGGIQGRAFADYNSNGVQDAGEPPIVGATVFVDVNNDGQPGAEEPSQQTGGNGAYSFPNVLAGSYPLRIVAPAGYAQAWPRSAAHALTVVANSTAANMDFGLFPTTITGTAANEHWYIRYSASAQMLQVFTGGSPTGTPRYSAVPSLLPSLRFNASGGADRFSLDLSGGSHLPAGGFVFNGQGMSGDTLAIFGDATATAVYTPHATVLGNGSLLLNSIPILLLGVDGVSTGGLGEVRLVTPNAADNLTLSSPAAGVSQVGGTSGGAAFAPLTCQAMKLVLDLATNDGINGDDVVTLAATGATGPLFSRLELLMGTGISNLNIQDGTFELTEQSRSPQGAPANLAVEAASLSMTASGAARVTIARNMDLAYLGMMGSARVGLGDGEWGLRTRILAVSGTGTLDLGEGSLVIASTAASRSTVLSQINNWIRSARNASPRWSGAGITALAGDFDSVGVLLNDNGGSPFHGTFGGQPADVNSILVRRAAYGDTDLSGRIDAADYQRINAGFAQGSGAGWRGGDADFSGGTNIDDYILIDSAYLLQQGAARTGRSAAAAVAVESAGAADHQEARDAVREPTAVFAASGVSLLSATGEDVMEQDARTDRLGLHRQACASRWPFLVEGGGLLD